MRVVVGCAHAASDVVSFLKSRYDLLTIPVAEVGQNVHVRVGLVFKKIIELVGHDYTPVNHC